MWFAGSLGVMPRECGASSIPEASQQELRRLWNTGSSAFADDDNGASSCLKTESESFNAGHPAKALPSPGRRRAAYPLRLLAWRREQIAAAADGAGHGGAGRG